MNTFLKEVSKVYEDVIQKPCHYKNLIIVLGNESCDLDSAISSLVYGFLLHHEKIQDNLEKTAVLPLLNIVPEDLKLKTEVVFFLEQNGIALEDIPVRGLRGLLNFSKMQETGALSLHLVDHHVLPESDANLKKSVEVVIDHRPQDPHWLWESAKEVRIELVGSCCTLIAKQFLDRSPHLLTPEIAKLLLGPIVIDTVNLSPEAGRATPLDEEVVATLEKIVTADKAQMLQDLVRARGSIETLTTAQILRKDLKIVSGIPLAGAPVLIRQLCKRGGFEWDLSEFMRTRSNIAVVILFGVLIEDQKVSRDFAIFSSNWNVADSILQSIIESTDPCFELEEIVDHGIVGMKLYNQRNTKATRKQIVPIVSKAAERLAKASNGI